MAGYSRNFSRVTGDTILANDFAIEFEELSDAFDETTGHTHDGSTQEGAYVPVLADSDGNNKVNIDTSNNEIEFGVEVAAAYTEQFILKDGVIEPTTDNDIDLGSSSKEFKNLYLDGTANIDNLLADAATIGATTFSATIAVTGDATFNGNVTIGNAATDTVTVTADVASNLIPSADNTYDLGGVGAEWKDLYIDGTANIDSLVADTADINAGTIDNATIGGTTPAAGTFTTAGITTGNIATLNVSTGVGSALIPTADDTHDLGSGAAEWKDLYIDGTANIDALVLGASAAVTSVDTDLSSVSASDDTLVSAKAIKAYVDGQITLSDLDFAADTGSGDVDLDAEVFTIAGGTGIDTTGAGTTVTIAIDSSVATLTGSQTLTNKTIDAASNTITFGFSDLSNIDLTGLNNGDILTYNSSSGDWECNGLSAASGVIVNDTTEKTSNFNVTDGYRYFVDCSAGDVTATLPLSPAVGTQCAIVDHTGSAGGTYTITIGRNSSNILGAAEDLVLDIDYAAVTLVYIDATNGWVTI